jgi:hypothetical protein
MLGREESEAPQVVVERIRHAMLFALDEYIMENELALELQLMSAGDIEGLWFLRTDVMYAIAARRGETVARDCLTQITALFVGHYPCASRSQFGAL